MIIAIWGMSASGKSSLADAIGAMDSQHHLTAVIDTDLCMPTLPLRIGGLRAGAEASLGRYLTGIGSVEANDYYIQHPQHKGLFFSGLTANDGYMSYEVGLEKTDRAIDFMERSGRFFDNIIIDCSVQRTDPFLGAILQKADVIVMPMIPKPAAVHWYRSVQGMLEDAGALEKCIPVANIVHPFHAVGEVENQLRIEFAAELPFMRDAQLLTDSGGFLTESEAPNAMRWRKQFKALYEQIQDYRFGGDEA